jgi:hypothetical protein
VRGGDTHKQGVSDSFEWRRTFTLQIWHKEKRTASQETLEGSYQQGGGSLFFCRPYSSRRRVVQAVQHRRTTGTTGAVQQPQVNSIQQAIQGLQAIQAVQVQVYRCPYKWPYSGQQIGRVFWGRFAEGFSGTDLQVCW